MASLRPSVFNSRERSDGGPFLLIEPVEQEEGFSIDVAFTDTPADQRQGEFPVARLLNVSPDLLRIWPLNVRQGRSDYLTPKYGSLESIVVAAKVDRPWSRPETVDDVIELLEGLPDGFAKDFRFGLGLLWEYRSICEGIAEQKLASMLIVHGGDEVTLTPPTFVLGVRRFHELRRQINRISARHQRDARQDKAHLAYQELLHAADPAQFPRRAVALRPDTLSEATRGGRDTMVLSRRDRSAAVRLVRSNIEALAESETSALLSLKSEIEQVTLKQLIDLLAGMLEKNLSEARWQSFLEQNPFILSLAFPAPVLVVQERAYVGGKRLNDRGGRIADFLCASASTGNLAVVEIKKPNSDLVANSAYRGDDVFGAASELSAAIAQALDQRLQLQLTWPALKEAAERADIHGFAIRCILIIGRTPEGRGQRRSFELYRQAMSEVTIVTFDELLSRLREIYGALAENK
ncbi:DUF4263 domain-containing protein [Caulobacter segnis]|uniref:Shedu protein SduA C-terminal domain-containing protein n=2 Tax=Caulobacter segnis TaxID=88688 RepID=D5VJ91_CAUST|nr:Shedu immune nuclease family protein [Caulobacter segnis]ADG10179.1 conserved hypothetical protein [Caulobacter segnis ATCC 21756]AVQ01925.1 DUF4263 domain-containing protein [Caulobacter segnis]